MRMVKCPACSGVRIVRYSVPPPERKRLEREACLHCSGHALITPTQAARIEHGIRLREERAQQGISLRAKARMLGISPRTLSDVEHGHYSSEYEDAEKSHFESIAA